MSHRALQLAEQAANTLEQPIRLGNARLLVYGNVLIAVMLILSCSLITAIPADLVGLLITIGILAGTLLIRLQMAYGEATHLGIRYKTLMRWRFVSWTEIKWIWYESPTTGPLTAGLYGPEGKGFSLLPSSRLVFANSYVLFSSAAKQEREERSKKIKAWWTVANHNAEE